MIFKHCEFDGLESQLVGKWEKPVGSSTEYEAFIVEASVWGRQGVIGAIEFEESGGDLPLFHLDDFEDDRIFEEDAKDVENAHHHLNANRVHLYNLFTTSESPKIWIPIVQIFCYDYFCLIKSSVNHSGITKPFLNPNIIFTSNCLLQNH